MNSSRKVNAMFPRFVLKLGLKIYFINVRMQKNDGSILKTLGMVLASFQGGNILGKAWFFQETFFLANFSIKVVLGMPFLIFSNKNIQFPRIKLI